MKDKLTLLIFVLVMFIIITQLIGYFEIQYYDYHFKYKGRCDYGAGWVFALVLGASFFGPLKALPKEWKEKHSTLCDIFCLVFSLTLSLTMMVHVKGEIRDIETEALKDSYTTIGHITQKKSYTTRGTTSYYIWAGINEKTTSRYVVNKQRYETSYVGAPVIMKVSRQYPCLNEILIWEPKPDDIDKYENKPTPPTADGSSFGK